MDWVVIDSARSWTKPNRNERVLVAPLNRFSNADWSFGVPFVAYLEARGWAEATTGRLVQEPYAWTRIALPDLPQSPERTKAAHLGRLIADYEAKLKELQSQYSEVMPGAMLKGLTDR